MVAVRPVHPVVQAVTAGARLPLSPARLLLVLLLPVAGLCLLMFSAFRIQVLDGAKHRKTVESLSFTQRQIPVTRGFILDRGHLPLAVPTELPSAIVDPVQLAMRYLRKIDPGITNLEYGLENEKIRQNLHQSLIEFSTAAAAALHEDPYVMREKVFESVLRGKRHLYLKRHISEDEQKSLEALGLPGSVMWFTPEDARHYPSRSLAAQILGFTGIDGHGVEGIEKKFDIDLAGSPALVRVQKDARSGMLLIHGLPDIEMGGANHVVLTIDSRIQKDTEAMLEQGLARYQAKNGAVLVMDAKTGEILAMANAPLADLSNRSAVPMDYFRNRVVVDAYELGSVIKPLTMVGAMDLSRISAASDIPLDFKVIFRDKPPWTPKDHISLAQATIKPMDIIARSSNRGIAKVAELMGERALYDLFVKLGFGQPTGVELPSEAAGILPQLKFWTNKVYLATHSYGHGFSLTMLQLAQAYTLFANEGQMVRPHVVRFVVDDRGERVACFSPSACGRPVPMRRVVRNPHVVAEVLQMMRKVVTAGTGTRADISRFGYSVAGKTGTAEKVGKGEKGGYSEHFNRVTFIGLVPAQDPKVVIAVMLDEPEGDPETAEDKNIDEILRKDAGYVAAPLFAEIARMVMYRLGVVPDLETTAQVGKGRNAPTIRRKVGGPYLPPLPVPEKVAMPDFHGRSLAGSLELMSENHLNCQVIGHGQVVSQEPEPGGPINACKLVLAPGTVPDPPLENPEENE